MKILKKPTFLFAPDAGGDSGGSQGGTGAQAGDTGGAGAGDGGQQSLADAMTGGEEKPSTQTDDKGGDGKGKTEPPAWMQQLTEDMRSDSELAKFQNLKELASAYKELAKAKAGVELPGADAKPEDVQAFFEKLGKPKTADGYDIVAADGTETEAFRKAAYDANLTANQAKAVFTALEKHGREMVEAHEAAVKRQFEETDAALRKEFGDKYGEKMEILCRGVNAFGGQPVQQKLSQAGLSFDPDIVRMFLRLGEISAEAGSVTPGAQGNAYRTTAEGGTFAFKGLEH